MCLLEQLIELTTVDITIAYNIEGIVETKFRSISK